MSINLPPRDTDGNLIDYAAVFSDSQAMRRMWELPAGVDVWIGGAS